MVSKSHFTSVTGSSSTVVEKFSFAFFHFFNRFLFLSGTTRLRTTRRPSTTQRRTIRWPPTTHRQRTTRLTRARPRVYTPRALCAHAPQTPTCHTHPRPRAHASMCYLRTPHAPHQRTLSHCIHTQVGFSFTTLSLTRMLKYIQNIFWYKISS